MYLACQETLHNHFIEGSCKYMGGELFAVSHNPDMSCDHMRCFLICHMASCEHMFKGLCEFMGEAHRVVSLTLLFLVVIGQAQVEI